MTTATADEWAIAPFVGVSEQFTDNAFGSSSDATSDYITSIDVGFAIVGDTLRSDVSVTYSINQDYYAHNHELDGYTQNLVGIGNFEFVTDSLFLDTRVTFTEETLSSAGPTSATDRTQASDRTQVFNGQISPYYVHNFAGWATGLARYSYSETIFSEPNVGGASSSPSNQRTNEYQLDFTSGRRFSKLIWAFQNRLIASEAEDGESFTHLSTLANSQFPINRFFSLIGTVGYDDFDADDIDNEEISGPFGGLGVRLHPNSRTDVSFQVGHRFGDTVFDMNASYSPTSLDTVTATYRVSVETAAQSLTDTELLDAQGDLIRPNFSVTDYIDDITKAKTFTLRWNGSRGRNNYSLTSDFIEREFLSDDSNDQTISLIANINRQLTPRATLSLSTGYSEVIKGQTSGAEENTYNLGLAYSYEFKNGLTGNASYDFLNTDSKSGADLRENAITLSIRKTF